MSKALDKNLKKIAKKEKLHQDYVAGGTQARHYYDSALRKIFGAKLGIAISDYLIKLGIKEG